METKEILPFIYLSLAFLLGPFVLFTATLSFMLLWRLIVMKALPYASKTSFDDSSCARNLVINLNYDDTFTQCIRILNILYPKAETKINKINGLVKSIPRYFRKKEIDTIEISVKRFDSDKSDITIACQKTELISPFDLGFNITKVEVLSTLLNKSELNDNSLKSMAKQLWHKLYWIQIRSFAMIFAPLCLFAWLKNHF